MGAKTQVLLVARAGAAAALALLAGCGDHRERRVEAARFDTFFVWPGTEASPALKQARTVYLLDGEVRSEGPPRLVRLRPAVPHTRASLWLVVRVERIDWTPQVTGQVLADLARWRAAGNQVAGVQIDFDAATRGLAGYVSFLQRLRKALPVDCGLSVTGLLDWSANADAADLARLAGTVDEIVVQTYQGRRTIPDYQIYVGSFRRIPLPYRVGLIEGGEWRPPYWLEHSQPNFRGYVVFLRPPAGP